MNYHAEHLLTRRSSIQTGVVAYSFDVDEDIASDVASLQVAIVEGYDVGEVVVTEELDVHRTMTLCRAENVVYLGNIEVALFACYLAQPTTYKSLLRQSVVALLCVERNIHSAKVRKNGIIYKINVDNSVLLGLQNCTYNSFCTMPNGCIATSVEPF